MRNSNNEGSCCAVEGNTTITDAFSHTVSKVSGHCKVGEDWSKAAINSRLIPVLSCEGPCAKGEIARRAAMLIPKIDERFERACHGEAFYVPHSTMAKWVKSADQVVMIDGCFLNCHGRVLENIIAKDQIVHINAHSIHKAFGDRFSCDDISEEEFSKLANQVAEKTIAMTLKGTINQHADSAACC